MLPLTGVLARAYQSGQDFAARLRWTLRARRVATFVADLDGVPVGMVVGNDYGALAYVAQMAVDPPMQGRGIATALMRDLLAWAAERRFAALELDATAAGKPLYAQFGFRVEGATVVLHGPGSDAPLPRGVRPARPGDRAALLAIDAAAFGADRAEALGALVDDPSNVPFVALARGRVVGYAIAQRRAESLGPVAARDAALAARLVDAARAALGALHRISVPDRNPDALELLARRDYRHTKTLAHMVHGVSAPASDALYARMNLGQG